MPNNTQETPAHKLLLSISPSSVRPAPSLSASTLELRDPPVDPRRSRRCCASFDAGEVDPSNSIDTASPPPPCTTSSPIWALHRPSFTSDSSSVMSMDPELMAPFDDSSSDMSSLSDIESFPLPPPSSPLVRKMNSLPMGSAEELMAFLHNNEACLRYAPLDLPPTLPLSIEKRRGSASSRFTSSSTECPSTSEPSPLRNDAAAADWEHRRSSTVRPPDSRSTFMIRSSTKSPVKTFTQSTKQATKQASDTTVYHDPPSQRAMSTPRPTMSSSASDSSTSFFRRARLGTRKSFANFRRPPPASSPADLPSLPLVSNASSTILHSPPSTPSSSSPSSIRPIIRKVASMRGPVRPGIRSDLSSERLALDRLEDSIAKLKAHGVGSSGIRSIGHRSHHSSHHSPQTTPGRVHQMPQSEYFWRSHSPYLLPPPHSQSFLSPRNGGNNSIPFPGVGFGSSTCDDLRSFIDITPERAGSKNVHQHKMKRLLANASQLIGFSKGSPSRK